eukprot:14375611-Alexandrium_andersonii.AAC.1
MKAIGWKRNDNELVSCTLTEAKRTLGREPALAAGHRQPQQPSQCGTVAALLGDVAAARHPGDEDVGLAE